MPSAAEVNLRAAAVPPASSGLKPDQEEIPACAAKTLWAPSLPPSVRSSFDSCCVLHQRKHIFPGGSACRRLLRSSFCMSVFLSLLFWFSNLWLQPPDSCHTGSLMGSCTRTWSQITAEERHTSGAEGEPPSRGSDVISCQVWMIYVELSHHEEILLKRDVNLPPAVTVRLPLFCRRSLPEPCGSKPKNHLHSRCYRSRTTQKHLRPE